MTERRTFCRTLDFNHPSVINHDHIHIGFCRRILDIFQITTRLAVHDTDRNGGNHGFQRAGFQLTFRDHLIQGISQCHTGATDRSGTGTAVSLDNITVEGDGELAQFGQINRSTQ